MMPRAAQMCLSLILLCVLSPLLPLLHEMNKELSFLSAAAVFNQWINVSTFVENRIGNIYNFRDTDRM